MVTGYRMTNHKHTKDVREELGITENNSVIKWQNNKWLEHWERMSEKQILKTAVSIQTEG